MANTLPFESIWAKGWLLGLAATEAPPSRTLVPALWIVALPALTQALFMPWVEVAAGVEAGGWDFVSLVFAASIVLLWWMQPLYIALPLAAALARRRQRTPRAQGAAWRPRAAVIGALVVISPLLYLLGLVPKGLGALRMDTEAGVFVGPLTVAGALHLAIVLGVAWVMARGIVRPTPTVDPDLIDTFD